MSQNLVLPDDLLLRLRQAATREGVSIEELLASWLETTPPEGDNSVASTKDEELLVASTRALREGREPPIGGDWDELEAALGSSPPAFPTVEDAMSALRGRRWVKDE